MLTEKHAFVDKNKLSAFCSCPVTAEAPCPVLLMRYKEPTKEETGCLLIPKPLSKQKKLRKWHHLR